jgi:hypothetical protein
LIARLKVKCCAAKGPFYQTRTGLKPMTIRNATITLKENSSAGNPPKTFIGQTVVIATEAEAVARSVDGFTSTARHPSKIFWSEGSAKDLASITNVKIASAGKLLIDGELNKTYGGPSERAGGVEFFVLRP